MRSLVCILVETTRSQAEMAELYFAQKAAGADEITLRRLQTTLLSGAASAKDIAASAEALERRALAAAEGQLAALRKSSLSPDDDHSPSPLPAA
ncbi:hypothetical protein [Brevundimonas sp.]|uniref:hypothetical protein n=1 Tax=Brevundimonas sp. TaxID=1871086 RepID=UPI002FCCA8A8